MKKEHVKINITDLKPHPKNPKGHDDKLIKQSISELGFVDDIIIDENNMILAGHGRLKAMTDLGNKDIDCIRITGWTEEQKEKFLILSNKSVEAGGWNDDLLKEFGKDLLKSAGFINKELDKLFFSDDDDDDVAPEAPDNPISKLGEVYQLGEHRIMCGDSTKIADVAKLMNGKKAQAMITDPPYGVNYSDKNDFLNKIDKGNRNQSKIENDNIENYREWFGTWLFNVKNYLDGVFYLFISGKEIHNLIYAIKDCGFKYSQDIVWVKNNHVLGRLDYLTKHENIIYGWIDTHERRGIFNTSVIDDEENFKTMSKPELLSKIKKLQNAFKTTIVRVNKPLKSELHPTMKPVRIISKFIFDSTIDNDIVLDLFIGSGSTLIACEKSDRICYGMELDPKYVDVTIARWEAHTDKKAELINPAEPASA